MGPKKRKPLTTNGWLRMQADEIISAIDKALAENCINADNFTLALSTSIVHNMCCITLIAKDGAYYETTANLFEKFNPFNNQSYWDKTQKIITDKYGFKKVSKTPNIRRYTFSK